MAEKLSEYRAKRHFDVTSEPSGDEEVAPSPRLRFVIQKHDATRLHYDFRLEWEGVFKSWAVTKGPSLDPHDRRLAVEVEDHPLDYGDFEGTIPKGQYGGGTVMLWDRGYWAPEPGTTVDEGLRKGDLKLVLDGQRLKGGWVLVRIRSDRERNRRTNWLLIKHRDGTERDGDGDEILKANMTSVASGRTMEQIAEGRPPGPTPFITKTAKGNKRAPAAAVWNSNRGDPEASAEKVAIQQEPTPLPAEPAPPKRSKKAKGKTVSSIPPFVEPELTKPVDRPPEGSDWAHEIKFDGYRMQLRVVHGQPTLKTRKGLDWTARFPEIVAEGASLPDGMIDGEIVALDENGSPDFAGLQSALSSGKTEGLIFFAFDLLFLAAEDLRELTLADRKARLQNLIDERALSRLRYVEHFEMAGDAVLKSACSMHLEGIVSKRLDKPYRSGRSGDWTKAKCRGGHEVVVAGWTSEGGANLRSLIAGVYRDGKLIHVGRVGTGFGRGKVDAILPKLKAIETDKSPFPGQKLPRGKGQVHWVKPELVAEIDFAGWTGDGHIRQASFKALREDKPAKEVVAETPSSAPGERARAEGAPKAKARAAKAAPQSGGNVVLGITISNPDKPLWPASGGEPAITKVDLARYLEAVGPAMMPHIEGRPCSTIRAPDGIAGECFFQRHAGKGASALITQVQVFGDHKPYQQFDRVEALIAAAQTACVEYHPWNCFPFKPEVPGRLVFDLDPAPDVPFELVIEGAKEVKARLEALDLVPFCKTTGGKGLHVVTPLAFDESLTWPEAKAFAKELCAQMAADNPARYLTVMTKAKRGGRIFLDYLRNDRMSTAVAPFSPRARPGAPVSMLLTWSQVKPGLDPKAYTMRTVPGLLKKLKAWSGYADAARPLRPAMAKLGKPRAA